MACMVWLSVRIQLMNRNAGLALSENVPAARPPRARRDPNERQPHRLDQPFNPRPAVSRQPSGLGHTKTVSMSSPHVYDKAKYHYETINQHGLSEEHAANHTVVFLRWLIEHQMMSDFFEQEAEGVLRQFRAGEVQIYRVYEWWDCCLVDDMLSDEGNAFAMHYFDFDRGRYIHDYIATLQDGLPSEFHVDYTEDAYQKMRQVIDHRYEEWKRPKRKWWPL